MCRELIAISVLAAVMAVSSACPEQECTSFRDCPFGELCDSRGRCVPEQPVVLPGEGEGERRPGEGEGEGDGEFPEVINVNAPVTSFTLDPANNGEAYIAFFSPGAIDELRKFELATATVSTDIERNFLSLGNGNCGLDTQLFFEDGAPVNLAFDHVKERWFSCRDGSVFIEYDDDFNGQTFRSSTLGGVELSRFFRSTDGTDPEGRLLYAKRGGTQLRNAVFNLENDAVSRERSEEPIVGVTFTAIAGIFKLVEDHDQIGDIALVFDRSDPPRLVPVQRDPQGARWHGPPYTITRLGIIELPAGTHVAFFRESVGVPDPINLNIASDDLDNPNVVVTVPAEDEGQVFFGRLEAEILTPGGRFGADSGFAEPSSLTFSDLPPGVPDDSDRILFEEIGGAFYYVLTNIGAAVQIPTPTRQGEDVTNFVKGGLFTNASTDRPSGFVLVDHDKAYISFSNKNELNLVEFDEAF